MFLKHVIKFHKKFDLRCGENESIACQNLSKDEIRFRLGFLFEELLETTEAFGLQIHPSFKETLIDHIRTAKIDSNKYDELEVIDGLLDLIYVSFGTLLLKELSEDQIRAHQDEIQRANMSKERSIANDPRSKRNHAFDVVKPEGWKGPNHTMVMDNSVKSKLNKG